MCSLSEVTRRCRVGPKPCCLCWCCCCSCSWAKCLAARNGSENGPTKKPKDANSNDDIDTQTTLEEIQSWGQSFDRLMRNSAGRKIFRDFLRCEYSEENIMFWLACEELKRETSPEAVEEKARFIYEDYISILSPKEVSLDSRVREIVNRNMVEPTPHTFDEAQLQIYTLMHRDSYPRFVNSTLYKTLAQISAGSAESPSSTTAATAPTSAPSTVTVLPVESSTSVSTSAVISSASTSVSTVISTTASTAVSITESTAVSITASIKTAPAPVSSPALVASSNRMLTSTKTLESAPSVVVTKATESTVQ